MKRATEREILDGEALPEEVVRQCYRQLVKIHRFLGDTALIAQMIGRDPLPVRRVLDVGCGPGYFTQEIGRRLGVETVGVDLKPGVVGIVQADATKDALPGADVAISLYVGHHLDEGDLAAMVRNVGLYCRRFILLDLVRHPLPLALFRVFIAPFVNRVVASDGQLSVRRAYTPDEFRSIVERALQGTATFRHTVTPLRTRQVVDISYRRD